MKDYGERILLAKFLHKICTLSWLELLENRCYQWMGGKATRQSVYTVSTRHHTEALQELVLRQEFQSGTRRPVLEIARETDQDNQS